MFLAAQMPDTGGRLANSCEATVRFLSPYRAPVQHPAPDNLSIAQRAARAASPNIDAAWTRASQERNCAVPSFPEGRSAAWMTHFRGGAHSESTPPMWYKSGQIRSAA